MDRSQGRADGGVSWYVDDLAAAIAEIRDAGIEMRELEGDIGHIVWISDPAGNTIELRQDPQITRSSRAPSDGRARVAGPQGVREI